MRGKTVQVDWATSDDAASLKRAYQQEHDAVVKPRLHLLWLVRAGKQIQEAAELVGVHNRTAQHWMAWYRDGGLESVRQRRKGGVGKVSRLDAAQKAALVAKSKEDGFVSVGQGVTFVQETFGIEYTLSGMTKVFAALQLRKKVPRPRNAKASADAQEAYKKGA